MLDPGSRLPEATVWRAPREPVTLAELGEEGAMLFLFYLFDWTGT